jgi:predicted HicB family RNase H-like nuclease
MTTPAKRSTIYFDQDIHAALRLKAAHSNKSLSELVNDAGAIVKSGVQ